MTQAAIAAEVHQALDVHRDFATQVALDEIVAIDRLADLQDLSVGQLVDAALGGDADLLADLLGLGSANAVDVLQADDDALAGGNVDARDTSHGLISMSAEAPDGTPAVGNALRPVEAGPCRTLNGPTR